MFRAVTQERFVGIVQTKFIRTEEIQPVILSTHNLQKDLRIKKLIFRLMGKKGVAPGVGLVRAAGQETQNHEIISLVAFMKIMSLF